MNYFILLALIFLAGSARSSRPRPPNPFYGEVGVYGTECKKISQKIDKLSSADEENPWELSGLEEGDIMVDPQSYARNAIPSEARRWPKGIVPYAIKENHFTVKEQLAILVAMRDYHKKTCIRFRPYRKGDSNWLDIRAGCACNSFVGMYYHGQVVNLHTPGCLRHGTILHELMHAVGFYHQQSAANRDQYVKILWENVDPDRKNNFAKEIISDSLGVEYDYESVMHYGSKAFSRNGKPTMVPLRANVTLGRPTGFTEKDIRKLDVMYRKHCKARREGEPEFPEFRQHFDEVLAQNV